MISQIHAENCVVDARARISLFLIGAAMMQRPTKRNWGLFTASVGVVAFAVWMVPLGGGIAVPEMLVSLPTTFWSIGLGVRLFKRALNISVT